MNATQDPYTTPNAINAAQAANPATDRLRLVWWWLGVASLGTLATTPADLIRISLGMLACLAFFLLGACLKLHRNRPSYLIATGSCLTTGVACWWLAWGGLPLPYLIGGIGVASTSISLGIASTKDIIRYRSKIYLRLAIAFTLGMLFGPLGALLLAVVTLLLTNRTAPFSTEHYTGSDVAS